MNLLCGRETSGTTDFGVETQVFESFSTYVAQEVLKCAMEITIY